MRAVIFGFCALAAAAPLAAAAQEKCAKRADVEHVLTGK